MELGCGWGSLTFYMAKQYPESRIVAVSNSNDQRIFIERKCEVEGITNIKVLSLKIIAGHGLIKRPWRDCDPYTQIDLVTIEGHEISELFLENSL